jgi:pimeloyl-ACP methyl ester carboxylesterase
MVATSTMIDGPAPGVRLEVLVEGSGPDVVLLPSANRGAADFALLQAALADAGYRSIAVNPRGAGASVGPTEGRTLRDIADDVAHVITTMASGPVHLVGHALGNIVARATASYRPDVVRTLAVMPCGGHNLAAHPMAPEIGPHVPRCHDMSLSEAERLESLSVAFFAPGNDPSSWLDGWWPNTGYIAAAFAAADVEDWWRGGSVPMLVVQPLDDVMGTVAAGRESAVALGSRAWYVEVPHCGHAILPEQPDVIADLVIRFLADHP